MTKQPTSGPFQIIGQIFGMVGGTVNLVNTIVTSVDDSASRTAGIIGKGFDTLDLVVDNAVLDFANDTLVADANRRVAKRTAEIEADVIIASLEASKAE
jgi:hypothetical protein